MRTGFTAIFAAFFLISGLALAEQRATPSNVKITYVGGTDDGPIAIGKITSSKARCEGDRRITVKRGQKVLGHGRSEDDGAWDVDLPFDGGLKTGDYIARAKATDACKSAKSKPYHYTLPNRVLGAGRASGAGSQHACPSVATSRGKAVRVRTRGLSCSSAKPVIKKEGRTGDDPVSGYSVHFEFVPDSDNHCNGYATYRLTRDDRVIRFAFRVRERGQRC